ncbi:MAG: Gfo/Idh/MocA family oxidoreductase [Desulfuromonadaceae bacterium]|nr:Gfo/Idh/MocA family oxidoreductase [Desulfuromonadaceae bacterium]
MIRVGILGCSDIARRKFIPALRNSRQARLVAVAGRQRERAAVLAADLSANAMTYEELVSTPAVDLLYISLPNHLHEEWSIRALEQGKHVICEKPLGLCLAAVMRMLEVADRHGRLLFENVMYLQHPQHMLVKDLLSSGRIGRTLSLRSEFAFPGPPPGDFRLDPAMGGGAYNDMNRYPLSAALYFLDGKEHRFCHGSEEIRDGLTISFQADSSTDSGESFSFMTAFGLPYRSFYTISGEVGEITVERAFTTPAEMENRIRVTAHGRDESFNAPASDHFLNTIEHVCGLIQCGEWRAEHLQARRLAALADLFHDNCMRRYE